MIVDSPETRNEFKSLIASNRNKNIIVKCYADWCGPCKRITDLVNESFEKLSGNKMMIMLNVDKQRDVSSFLKIKQLPTILSYKEGIPNKVIMTSDESQIKSFFNNL